MLFNCCSTRGIHNFYYMSYLYFGAMATSTVVLVGLFVSCVTGEKLTEMTSTQYALSVKTIL